ncbi:hypothetical protein JCM15519_35530 [Fundidesulfovibrio butyratiphilus]
MAKPKKKKKKSFFYSLCTSLLAGLTLPVFLAYAWMAYCQPEANTTTFYQTASMDVKAPNEPVLPPEEEYTRMRDLFDHQVRQAVLKRFERYKRDWSRSPKLQKIMEERRQRLLRINQAYYDFVRRDIQNQMRKAGLEFTTSQYFVYADRNPRSQIVLVGFYNAQTGEIEFLGGDLISSGNLDKEGDYFVTPVGVFENLLENFSYRALGTPNQEGWRGLGAKDSRVWDFGYQKSVKKYKGGNTMSEMRLLMHATDPDKGEPRLGRTDSKGCVRISGALNRFLDTYAILDEHYEEWARTKPDSWLLKKDRQPVGYPGKYLIIGDSAPEPQTASKP